MKTFLKVKWGNNLECPPLAPTPLQPTPYLWAIFSWPPSLSKFQKQETHPPLILGERGGETMLPHAPPCIDLRSPNRRGHSPLHVLNSCGKPCCDPCIYNHVIFRTLAYLELQASSNLLLTCKMFMHIRSPSIVRTIYPNIFKNI